MGKNLLIVVDYQNDFVIGSLGFEKAVSLALHICDKIKMYRHHNDCVLFTLDSHTDNYMQTQEGKHLPVPHCIEGTEGIHLFTSLNELVSVDDVFIKKGTFGASGLIDYLKQNPFDKIEFVGVVSNICVISNAVIAKTILPEAEIVIDARGTASFDDALHEKALDVMEGLQMTVINR